jgi:hypothetical protein
MKTIINLRQEGTDILKAMLLIRKLRSAVP